MSITVKVTQTCDRVGCQESRELTADARGPQGTSISVADANHSGWRFVQDRGWLCPETIREIFGR